MPILDDFKGYSPSMQSPVTHGVAVVPDDAADLTHLTRALYIGTGGDVRVTLADGSAVTFVNMVQGWHPMRVARVFATGTTADHMVGCW